MYCNFRLLIEKNLTGGDLITLLKISQRESHLLVDTDISKYEELGLVQYLKGKTGNENARLSPKGKALLSDIATPEFTEEIGTLLQDLLDIYDEYDKDAGNPIDIKKKLVWFCNETNFSTDAVKKIVEDYLSTRSEYIMKLENLLWKGDNIFSVHMNLKDSKLYELFQKKYKLPITSIADPTKSNVKGVWLHDCSRLKVPSGLPEELYWTGSKKGDEEKLLEIKKAFRKLN